MKLVRYHGEAPGLAAQIKMRGRIWNRGDEATVADAEAAALAVCGGFEIIDIITEAPGGDKPRSSRRQK